MFYSKTEILPLRYDDVFCCYPWKSFLLVVLVRILKKHHPLFRAPLNKHNM